MKFVIVLLALVAVVAGHEFQEILEAKERSISSQIVDTIEAAKLQMPCGFPGLGLPPMAPLKWEEKEINTHGDALDIKAILARFRLYGLDNFDIVEFKVNAILSKVTFKFHWHDVNFRSKYDFWMKMHNSNLFSQLLRDGGAKLSAKNLELWGTIKYSLGLVGSGGLRLKECKIYAKVGDVKSDIDNLSGIGIVNRKLNEIIEEWLMLAINDNTDNLAEFTNNILVPKANDLIGDRTLGDLLAMIGGGGGEGEPVEKPVCVPPMIED